MIPKFFARKIDGKLQFEKPELYRAYISGIKADTRIEITIKPYKRKRSDQQNRFYWGVVVPILANHFGYTKDEMHDALRWEFLRREGEGPTTARSTTSLTTVEFIAYIDSIVIWAATNYQIVIPDPYETSY